MAMTKVVTVNLLRAVYDVFNGSSLTSMQAGKTNQFGKMAQRQFVQDM
jgi:hypothetical protein